MTQCEKICGRTAADRRADWLRLSGYDVTVKSLGQDNWGFSWYRVYWREFDWPNWGQVGRSGQAGRL
jgi:hypothetical protein